MSNIFNLKFCCWWAFGPIMGCLTFIIGLTYCCLGCPLAADFLALFALLDPAQINDIINVFHISWVGIDNMGSIRPIDYENADMDKVYEWYKINQFKLLSSIYNYSYLFSYYGYSEQILIWTARNWMYVEHILTKQGFPQSHICAVITDNIPHVSKYIPQLHENKLVLAVSDSESGGDNFIRVSKEEAITAKDIYRSGHIFRSGIYGIAGGVAFLCVVYFREPELFINVLI